MSSLIAVKSIADTLATANVSESVVYLISTQGYRGNYKVMRKTFNNDRHFSNWYDLVTRKGLKIIGVEKI